MEWREIYKTQDPEIFLLINQRKEHEAMFAAKMNDRLE